MCTEYRAGPGWKTFASPTRWGQKVLPTGERTYSYVGRKFSVLRAGEEGRGETHARRLTRRADVTVLLRTLLQTPELRF